MASRVLGRDTTTDRFRKAGVRVFSWVMSAMGRTKLTDTSNGYRALRVSMLDDVAHRLVQAQYQTAELLIIAMRRGWRVTERPTVWLPRASGTTKKGKNWLFGFRYGRVVFGTWWKVRKEPRHTVRAPALTAASTGGIRRRAALVNGVSTEWPARARTPTAYRGPANRVQQ